MMSKSNLFIIILCFDSFIQRYKIKYLEIISQKKFAGWGSDVKNYYFCRVVVNEM